MLLLGHRDARDYAAENTILAFDLALDHGAHGFEFDVRRTRDNRAIIGHVGKLHRLVSRRNTLARLQQTASPERMPPTLEEVLERYGRTAFINIEVKVRGLEAQVARAVKQARPERYFISSFLP